MSPSTMSGPAHRFFDALPFLPVRLRRRLSPPGEEEDEEKAEGAKGAEGAEGAEDGRLAPGHFGVMASASGECRGMRGGSSR